MSGTCKFCGKKINPDTDFQRIQGWEKRRSQGGTNQIVLREPQPEWACWGCIDKLKRGIAVGQDKLL